MRVLSYMVIAIGLVGSHAGVSQVPRVDPGMEARVQASKQERAEVPVDHVLARRWSEFFAHVIEQFQSENRSLVGNIEGDFSTRELRVRATSVGDSDSLWVSTTLTEQQLRGADLRQTARNLYAAAKRKAGER